MFSTVQTREVRRSRLHHGPVWYALDIYSVSVQKSMVAPVLSWKTQRRCVSSQHGMAKIVIFTRTDIGFSPDIRTASGLEVFDLRWFENVTEYKHRKIAGLATCKNCNDSDSNQGEPNHGIHFRRAAAETSQCHLGDCLSTDGEGLIVASQIGKECLWPTHRCLKRNGPASFLCCPLAIELLVSRRRHRIELTAVFNFQHSCTTIHKNEPLAFN